MAEAKGGTVIARPGPREIEIQHIEPRRQETPQERAQRRRREAKPPPTDLVYLGWSPDCARPGCGLPGFVHTGSWRESGDAPAELCDKYMMPRAQVLWHERNGFGPSDGYGLGTSDYPVDKEASAVG